MFNICNGLENIFFIYKGNNLGMFCIYKCQTRFIKFIYALFLNENACDILCCVVTMVDVTTLALGSRPRQGLTKSYGPRMKLESHMSCSWECRKV